MIEQDYNEIFASATLRPVSVARATWKLYTHDEPGIFPVLHYNLPTALLRPTILMRLIKHHQLLALHKNVFNHSHHDLWRPL